ncbi:prolipoprotein diacylglyceryl transferase [Motiliproteus sp. MSK22-1]|uniref:prolipoprotein diacylglyceryl transferase n=1 Tax=Motiliproteus sp. MSK22-1 TaxID=1897630 RepID=UPI0009784A9F|nr:prolipoprotein diacylglyceryl transferase [Motiliproteus sp. MSK22-1]OMH31761.1 prolipoprotein diacylglyceryl transferase [Motiliproteus sp. MSK22-1]
MLTYPNIDPVALAIGPLKIHWYGLMYLVGFGAAWWLANYRAGRSDATWSKQQVSDLIFWSAVGVIFGGRAGYVLFYNFEQFLANPLWLFKIWEGGMSFHGGLLGVTTALFLYGRQINKSFFEVADFTAPLVPLGLAAGRIGNFIGGELWGRVTDASWAMVFPGAGTLPRHPSQLYQFALEGLLLFTIVWWFSSKPRPRMAVSGLFLLGYGSFRFFVEQFRQPDAHIGFVLADWITMGQLLSTPMILLGAFMLSWSYLSKQQQRGNI